MSESNGLGDVQAIEASQLNFSFPESVAAVLRGVDLHLPQGSRCLLFVIYSNSSSVRPLTTLNM